MRKRSIKHRVLVLRRGVPHYVHLGPIGSATGFAALGCREDHSELDQ